MVEANLAKMIKSGDQQSSFAEQDSSLQLEHNGGDDSSMNILKDSTSSYGRKRGLPIEQRSQLWL